MTAAIRVDIASLLAAINQSIFYLNDIEQNGCAWEEEALLTQRTIDQLRKAHAELQIVAEVIATRAMELESGFNSPPLQFL